MNFSIDNVYLQLIAENGQSPFIFEWFGAKPRELLVRLGLKPPNG